MAMSCANMLSTPSGEYDVLVMVGLLCIMEDGLGIVGIFCTLVDGLARLLSYLFWMLAYSGRLMVLK